MRIGSSWTRWTPCGWVDALSGESLEAKVIDFAVDRAGLRARAAAGM